MSPNPFTTPKVWQNGSWVEPHLSLFNRTFQYSEGVFTTIRFDRSLKLFPLHLKRLKNASDRLGWETDWAALEHDLNVLTQQLTASACSIKIILSPKNLHLGYLNASGNSSQWWIIVSALPQTLLRPLNVGLLETPIGTNSPALAGIKSTARTEQVYFSQQLQQLNAHQRIPYDDALLFDISGVLIESLNSNVFYKCLNDSHWYTPKLEISGIHGVMRAHILDTLPKQGVPIQKKDIHKNQIHNIESMILCNALRGVQFVHTLDHKALNLHLAEQVFKPFSY